MLFRSAPLMFCGVFKNHVNPTKAASERRNFAIFIACRLSLLEIRFDEEILIETAYFTEGGKKRIKVETYGQNPLKKIFIF